MVLILSVSIEDKRNVAKRFTRRIGNLLTQIISEINNEVTGI